MSDTLAKEFNEEMLLLFKRIGEAVGYWPRYFLRKVRQVGGLKMAQDLLQPTTAHKGFGRLAEEKKLELSVEYMVLLPKWAPLFTEEERRVARERLVDAGYEGIPEEVKSDDRIVYFNNCRNRDHAALFHSDAFYDLNTTGIQATQATDLRPGQECVVATTADAEWVTFAWYSFLYEQLLREKTGDGDKSIEYRVFIGTKVLDETMSKTEAASDPLYSPFFNVNGHFKQRSAIWESVPSKSTQIEGKGGQSGAFQEGSAKSVTLTVYERNTAARKRCIDHYGTACHVCGFDFGAVYGVIAKGFIHVHHLKAISEIGKQYTIDPIKDLRPVCPNCHAVIHLGGETRGLEDMRKVIERARRAGG